MSDVTTNATSHQIIDQVWMNVFCLFNVRDFLSVHISCKLFNKLTNSSINHRIINNHWKFYCMQTNSFNTKNWKIFYTKLFAIKEYKLLDNKVTGWNLCESCVKGILLDYQLQQY